MKKIMNWVLAATLVCGASVFTACTSDSSDNPSKEQAKKNRTEFIQHTRSVMKDLAENLNFSTWNSVNYFNTYFNEYVLLNDNFDKTLSRVVGQGIQSTLQPISAEFAEVFPGAKYMAFVKMADLNYTFSTTETGFNVAPNNNEGLVVEIVNPYDSKYAVKMGIKGTGTEYNQISEVFSNDTVKVFFQFCKHYDLTLSTMQNGAWTPNIVAGAELDIDNSTRIEGAPENATYLLTDAWNLNGTVKTSIPGDATELVFNIGQDPRTHQAGMTFDFTHNGQKRVALRAVGTNESGYTDLSFLTGSSSILSVIGAVLQGKSVDDLTLTLNDDLTTTMKVSDCQKVMQIETAMNKARRSYADQQTMSGFAEEMNKYISFSMVCKGVNQTIPMRISTAKIGVDWWVVPAFNFSDENGYTPLPELLDKESLAYGINIIDHAAEPMQESIIVARQLAQALQKLQTAFLTTKPTK